MDLFKPEIVNVADIKERVDEIVANSYRLNAGDFRPPEVRLRHAQEGLAIERALVQKGAIYNPLQHNKDDPESFAYDVIINGKRTEVKRLVLGRHDRFLSYNKSKFSRFEKYQGLVDLFVGGTVKWSPCKTKIHVQIRLITHPKILFEHSHKSKYPEQYGHHNYYFNHLYAPAGSYEMDPNVSKRSI